jgi:two-component system nitrogen regulation response regulator GlnG
LPGRLTTRADQVTVLIVEDDSTTRQTFEIVLAAEGYIVHSAATAEEGLAEAAKDLPDVVLLDLHLPVIDGLEWLRQLRAVRAAHDVPVAIVTGDYFLDEEVAREIRALGARIHFKPLWDSDLKRIVQELLSDA